MQDGVRDFACGVACMPGWVGMSTGFECCMQLNSGSFYPPDKHLRKLDADNDKVGRIVVGTEENGGEHY